MSKVRYTAIEIFVGLLFVGVMWFFAYGFPTFEKESLPAVFGFGGTLIGAAVGAVTAFLVRSKEKTDRQITDAYSVLLRTQTMLSDLQAIRKWIDRCLALARSQGVIGNEHWKRITPMVGVPSHVELPTRELSFFAEAREYELLQDVMTLGMRHFMMVESAAIYSKLHDEFGNKLSELPPAEQDLDKPRVLGVLLTDSDVARLRGSVMKLESLMASILRDLDANIKFGESVIQRIPPAARYYFGETKFPLRRVSFTDQAPPNS